MTNSNKKTKKQGSHYCQKYNDDRFDPSKLIYKDYITKIPNNLFSIHDKACNKDIVCDYLSDHENTLQHIKKYEEWKRISVSNTTLDSHILLNNQALKLQCQIALYISKKNLPISAYKDVQDLFISSFPDQVEVSLLKLNKPKVYTILKSLSCYFTEENYQDLKTSYYSLIYDESSIKGNKYASFIIRKTESDLSKVTSLVLKVIPISKSDAQSVYEEYQKLVTERNIEKTMTGVGLDNANVMVGANNSFKTRLIAQNPNLVCVPCSLHIINLCDKEASKCIPKEVLKLPNQLYSYFSRSNVRYNEFAKVQKNMNIIVSRIPQPCITRWLSREKCLRRINEKWPALISYFEIKVQKHPKLLDSDDLLIAEENKEKDATVTDDPDREKCLDISKERDKNDQGKEDNLHDERETEEDIKISKRGKERKGDEEVEVERGEQEDEDDFIINAQSLKKSESFINHKLNDPQVYYYNRFLEKVLAHSCEFVLKFEHESYDVAKVYGDLKEYCLYYINRIRSIDSIDVSFEDLMESIREKTFAR